ncbi:MAG: DUF2125 domain-containing protein [Pseudorhodobacter sp.]|nr:DUF2125 domain-containing protein [Pseudorhodobacter sp.]
MTQWKTLGASAAISALLGSGAVWADVTADQVWDSWSGSLEAFGYTVATGSEQRAGDTLVLTNVVLSMTQPEGDFEITLSEIRLKETGDGKVSVTVPNEIPLVAKAEPDSATTVDITMMLRQQGLALLVSGSESDMAYDTSATEISVDVEAIESAGTSAPVKLLFTATDLAGAYSIATEGGQQANSELSVAKVSLAASGADPSTNATFNMNGAMQDLSSVTELFLPDGVDMNDMAAAVAGGFYVDSEISFGAGNYAMEFTDDAGSGTVTTQGDGGMFFVSLSGEGMEYGVEGNAFSVSMLVPDLPVPIDFALQGTSFLLSMPISKGEESQSFAVKLGLAGLSVSEQIWAMGDPLAQLPHTPFDLMVDLSGSAKLLVNLFDPTEVQSVPLPAEVEAVDINEVHLAALGADLSGTGAFTFDNSMGMPIPNGAVDMRLVGAYALMDKLSAMGMLPPDQVAGFRAMLGLFSVPAGDDVLTSKIEIRDDGGVYANGQRLQ